MWESYHAHPFNPKSAVGAWNPIVTTIYSIKSGSSHAGNTHVHNLMNQWALELMTERFLDRAKIAVSPVQSMLANWLTPIFNRQPQYESNIELVILMMVVKCCWAGLWVQRRKYMIHIIFILIKPFRDPSCPVEEGISIPRLLRICLF